MSIIVQKFGGSSVADTQKLFNVCKHITSEYKKGKGVVVVVSAQGKTTDKFIKEAKEISSNLDKRELDVLLSAGEQITIAKLSMCLKELGFNAISLTGWQVPIKTNDNYGNADIIRINIDRILEEIDNGKIVVIAGFQGINLDNDITTLGRGGSDTTAVAIAAALQAERCDIYTDVDGVYDKDPRKNRDAKKYMEISYEKMLELANAGAEVLHVKCIKLAQKFNVPVYVRTSFNSDLEGTYVVKKAD